MSQESHHASENSVNISSIQSLKIPQIPTNSTVVVTSGVKRPKRLWKKITEEEHYKLKAAVSFGLPVDFAGKILNMNKRNANRIMCEEERRKEIEQ